MNDFEEIIKLVAVKHSILIKKDDPSLVSVTILDSILEQHVNTLNAQQEEIVKKLLNALQQGNIEAKNTAKRVINEATNHVSDQVHIAVTSAMDEGRENLRKDLEYAWENIEKSRKAAMNWAIVSGLCMAVTAGMIWFA